MNTRKLVDPGSVGIGIEDFIARTADSVRQAVLEAQAEWHAKAGVNLSNIPYDVLVAQRAYVCDLIGTELIEDR